MGAGPEDLVAVKLNDEMLRQRIFAREVERGFATVFGRCETDECRIGRIDIGPESAESGSRQTVHAWRPEEGEKFHPLGMSLVRENDGEALYLIDNGTPAKLRKLSIKDGEIEDADIIFKDEEDGPLIVANDLQAVGDRIYVTRLNPWGFLPWRAQGWRGIAEVRDGEIVKLREEAFPGRQRHRRSGQGQGSGGRRLLEQPSPFHQEGRRW